MRTATTLHRTPAGWILAAGPDVSADKQRKAFANAGNSWPKDVLEIRMQLHDGRCKTRTADKAKAIAQRVRDAEKNAADKIAKAKKRDEEAEAEAKASADKSKAEEAKAVAEANKAKEDAKKAAAKVKL